MNEETTLEDIKSLIDRLSRNAISVQEFCTLFERVWNFEFDKGSVSNEIFESLDPESVKKLGEFS